jgi:hypothetical protein
MGKKHLLIVELLKRIQEMEKGDTDLVSLFYMIEQSDFKNIFIN